MKFEFTVATSKNNLQEFLGFEMIEDPVQQNYLSLYTPPTFVKFRQDSRRMVSNLRCFLLVLLQISKIPSISREIMRNSVELLIDKARVFANSML